MDGYFQRKVRAFSSLFNRDVIEYCIKTPQYEFSLFREYKALEYIGGEWIDTSSNYLSIDIDHVDFIKGQIDRLEGRRPYSRLEEVLGI